MPQADLKAKVPVIECWMDDLLAKHSGNARSPADFHFKRLSQFYSEELLRRARVVVVDHLPVPPLKDLGLAEFAVFEEGDYAGITFKDTYFVLGGVQRNESLHFHELVHVIQWAHLGVERFLLAYAAGLMANGYENSPLEMTAYSLEKYFEHDCQPTNIEAIVRKELQKYK